jgi:hypothetical protein
MWYYSLTQLDIDYFVTLLQDALKAVEIRYEKSLFNDKMYVYTHALGLVGAGVEWERRAVEEMFRTKSKILTREHMATTRLSNLQLEAMARDMKAFEKEFSDNRDFDISKHFGERTKATAHLTQMQGRSRRPGKRIPKRDPTSSRHEDDA